MVAGMGPFHWLLHVTGGDNGSGPFYLEWSGFISLLFACGFVITWFRHSRCHVEKCNRHGKFPFHHYKLCKKHHPLVPQVVTHKHIKDMHKASYYER